MVSTAGPVRARQYRELLPVLIDAWKELRSLDKENTIQRIERAPEPVVGLCNPSQPGLGLQVVLSFLFVRL